MMCEHVVGFQLSYDFVNFFNQQGMSDHIRDKVSYMEMNGCRYSLQRAIDNMSNWDCGEGFFIFCPKCGQKNSTKEEILKEIEENEI